MDQPPAKKMKVVSRAKAERDELRSEIDKLTSEIDELTSEIQETKSKIKEAESKEGELPAQLMRKEQLRTKELRTSRKEEQLKELKADIWISLDGEISYERVAHNHTIPAFLLEVKGVSIADTCCLFNNSPLTDYELTLDICEFATSQNCHIEVYTKLDITCTVNFACKTEEMNVSVKAGASVDSLVSALCKKLGVTVSHDDVGVFDGSGSKIDNRRVLVKSFPSTNFSFCCDLTPKKRIAAMVDYASPASGFPSKFSQDTRMAFEGAKFLCHRKGFHGDTVSLYYSGFAEFEKLCKSIVPTWQDCQHVAEICYNMEQYFADEPARQGCFNRLLTSYLGICVAQGSVNTNCDGGTVSYPALVNEYKNEVGAGGCDSYTEAMSYYVQMLKHCTTWEHWAQPAFLCELVGPHFMISGIVYGERIICVDRLDSVWLVTQPNVPWAMERVVKVFAALKKCVCDLYSEYQSIQSAPETNSHCLKFPRFPTFQEYDGNIIQYERRLGVNLFCGVVNSSKVLIKFTHTYCAEAHKLLEEKRLSPRLYHVFESHNMKAIVMELLEGFRPIDVYLSSVGEEQRARAKINCLTALQVLHDNDYVHGDFRPCNILVLNDESIRIVDFDWSGKVGDAKYPLFMNRAEIEWPDGAWDGQCIEKVHDIYFCNKL